MQCFDSKSSDSLSYPILPITSGKNIRACAMLQLANQKQIKVSKENKTISEYENPRRHRT